MPKRRFLEIGTISEGTLDTADLVEAFSDVLKTVIDLDPDHAQLVTDAESWLNAEPTDIDDEGHGPELVEELLAALNSYAPPYTYVGTLEGDGACFGCWPSIDSMENDARYNDGLIKVNDLADLDPAYTGTIMLVNDHGNVTCGHASRGKMVEEYWSCV